MATPQQPELHRSGHNAADEASPKTNLQAQRDDLQDDAPVGAVPEANQPGHHPDHDHDKPTEAFVDKARKLAEG